MAANFPPAPGGSGGGGITRLQDATDYPQGMIVTDRGLWTANTTYAVGDVVSNQGARWLVRTAYTSSTFFSTTNLFRLGGMAGSVVNAYDHGVRGDGTTDCATTLQAAIDYCASLSGGVVELPFGYVVTSATIILKPYVWLRGRGKFGTVLKLLTNANCDVIQNHVSTGNGDPNASYCGVFDLAVDGNKANQNGAGPYHGISFTTNPLVSAQTGTTSQNPEWFDMQHIIQNVRVYKTKGDGIHLAGRSGISLARVEVFQPDGYGFVGTFDTNYVECESNSAGLAGFSLNNGSTRLTACKAYLSGQVDHTNGAGFKLGSNANGVTLGACEAQNNYGPGFDLQSANRCNIQGIADSNNFDVANTYAAVNLNNSSYNIIDVVCWQGTQGGTQVGHQDNALSANAGSDNNNITLTHSAALGATVGTALASGSVLSPNSTITVNGAPLVFTSLDARYSGTPDKVVINRLMAFPPSGVSNFGANTAAGCRWIMDATGTLGTIAVYIGATSGNIDVGLYDASVDPSTKLWSSGSTAAGTAFTWQTFTPNVAVKHGQHLYVAVSADNATVTIGRSGWSDSAFGFKFPVWFTSSPTARMVFAAGASFPLPTSFTDASLSGTSNGPAVVGKMT